MDFVTINFAVDISNALMCSFCLRTYLNGADCYTKLQLIVFVLIIGTVKNVFKKKVIIKKMKLRLEGKR